MRSDDALRLLTEEEALYGLLLVVMCAVLFL